MSSNQTARLAGFIYLIIVLTGFFNLVYVPSELIIWSDSTKTVNNIIDREVCTIREKHEVAYTETKTRTMCQ